MKRSYLISAFVFGVLACLTLTILATLPPQNRPGVTKANFDRIKKGMSLKQVETILGEKYFLDSTFCSGAGGFETNRWSSEDGASANIRFLITNASDGPFVYEVWDMTWTDSTETTFQRIIRWMRFVTRDAAP